MAGIFSLNIGKILLNPYFRYFSTESNHDLHPTIYFWRTREGAEVDYIEDASGILHAYAFKWKGSKRVVFPRSFTRSYPNAVTTAIDQENVSDFLLPQ